MALSNQELPHRLSYLNGYLTTREAAAHLHMSYWHFMHLVEAERIPGIRVVDRWIFSPADLDTYRKSTKSGEVVDLAHFALSSPHITLTSRQHAICEALITGIRPAEIARNLQQTRQAVHAQIALIREKVEHEQASHQQPPRRIPARRRVSAVAAPVPISIAPLME